MELHISLWFLALAYRRGETTDYFLANAPAPIRLIFGAGCDTFTGIAADVNDLRARYMGLVLTPFPGLHQMALFSVIGLIFSWLTVVFWFPTLVHASTLKNPSLLNRYGSQLTRWPLFHYDRRPLLTAASIAGLAVSGWLYLDVQDDVRHYKIAEKFNRRSLK